MLRAHAGVVQARTHAVGFGDLTVLVLEDVGAIAMQHTRLTSLQRGRMLASI